MPRRVRRPSPFFLGTISLALAFALVPESGCVEIPADGAQPALATHVQDWRDEVVYQAIVDRFANGDVNNDYNVQPGSLGRYQGGDWKGMEEHLDYLQELGVTTIWISPIVRNVETDADVDGYHGYWQQDLTELNPHMGDLASLRSMVASAHDRGMKIVLDVVVNHMGQVFFYDMNLNGHPDEYIAGTGKSTSPVTRSTEYDPDFDPRGVQAFTSAGDDGRAPIIFIVDPAIQRLPPRPGILGTAAAYHGMGRILNYDIPEQRLLGDFPGGLKDVATELPEVRATLVDAFTKWVELVDFDGFRLDTVKHVESDFWTAFAPAVRARLAKEGKTNFLLFGEAFDGNDQLLGSYTQPGMLDSVFYFSQHYSVFRDVFENAHDATAQKGTDQIAALWGQKVANYGGTAQDQGIGVAPRKAITNFIDNHDVARFLFDSAGDLPALRNALTYLVTEEGIPCIYYGTEQEFSGGNDPANREVLWNTNFDTSGDTFRHLSKLTRLRKGYVALRRGDTTIRYSTSHVGDEEDAGIFAFERAGGDAADKYALVILNTNDRHASSTSLAGKAMVLGAAPGSTLVDVLDPQHTTYAVGSTGELGVKVDAQKAMILVPQDQVIAGI